MRRVILLAEAREDALEAFRWYENERPDLGKVFRAALNDTIRRIRTSPLASAVMYRDMRRALVDRFPYAIFYPVQPEAIVIVGVIHGHRHPRCLAAASLRRRTKACRPTAGPGPPTAEAQGVRLFA